MLSPSSPLLLAPPGPDAAVVFQRQAEEATCGDGGDAAKCASATRTDNLHGRAAISVAIVTQLTKAVVAPAPHTSITLDRQAMVVAGGDSDDARQKATAARSLDLYWLQATLIPLGAVHLSVLAQPSCQRRVCCVAA